MMWKLCMALTLVYGLAWAAITLMSGYAADDATLHNLTAMARACTDVAAVTSVFGVVFLLPTMWRE